MLRCLENSASDSFNTIPATSHISHYSSGQRNVSFDVTKINAFIFGKN